METMGLEPTTFALRKGGFQGRWGGQGRTRWDRIRTYGGPPPAVSGPVPPWAGHFWQQTGSRWPGRLPVVGLGRADRQVAARIAATPTFDRTELPLATGRTATETWLVFLRCYSARHQRQRYLGGHDRMSPFPKVVTSPHYHVWTDALHARALAHQARNKWDRGTYVRWCVASAWTALEIACQEATGEQSISYRFKENLDAAIKSAGKAPLQWGSGAWQKVTEVQQRRITCVHRFVTLDDYFPPAAIADETIVVMRNAIVDIYRHMQREVPAWTADDHDRGWNKKESVAYATAVHAEADKEQDAIRICYVADEIERQSIVLPAGSEWKEHVEGLLQRIIVPITQVRVYQGQDLIWSTEVRMRGS